VKVFSLFIMLSLLLAAAWSAAPVSANEKWVGVDEVVIGEFAKEMGKTPSDPLIDMGQGDLLLSMFLLFGAIGGFVAGYYFRELFPRKRNEGGS
jgi:hypothetical protein